MLVIYPYHQRLRNRDLQICFNWMVAFASAQLLLHTHTMPQFSVILGFPVDLPKCLSSLVNVQGCLSEIYKSVFTGKFDITGPMCCKAVRLPYVGLPFSAVDAKCWPQMFPLNPFVPPLLKIECSRINASAPAPIIQNALHY